MKSTRTISRRDAICASIFLFLSISFAPGQFVAFNGPGPAGNATRWNIFGDPPGTAGPLHDIASGSLLPVTLAITTNGLVSAAPGGVGPLAGTPLYDTFHGFVDPGATGPDILAQVSGLSAVTYTFTGLNTGTVYNLRGAVVASPSSAADPQEWSLLQLNSALAFNPAHTP